tara:strand:- start:274 stop:558 length:285 start_codon:yes stop_codon:yes gene_type:complete
MENQQIIDQVIDQLKQIQVSEEELEYVLTQIGMKSKILHQLKNDHNITRFEVINHAKNDMAVGRVMTLYKEMNDFDNIELSYQDGHRTLKVFLD